MLERSPVFPLKHTDVERPKFRDSILPFAAKARELKKVIKEIDSLAKDDQALAELALEAKRSSDPSIEQELMGFASELRARHQRLEHLGYSGRNARLRAENDRILACNEVISVVSVARVRKARIEDRVTPEASSTVIIRAQLVSIPIRDLYEKPFAPPYAHQDLGIHPTSREGKLPETPVTKALRTQTSKEWADDRDRQLDAQSVARLLPDKILRPSQTTPEEYRDTGNVIRGVMEVTDLVKAMTNMSPEHVRAITPTPDQYATPGPLQQAYVQRIVDLMTVFYLGQEMVRPGVTKATADDLHLQFNKELRGLIRTIGNNGLELVRNALLHNRYDCQANALSEDPNKKLESPDVLQALAISRLSTSLSFDLGVFEEGIISEHRASEMIRNVVFNKNITKRNSQIEQLILAIHQKYEDGELNASEVFETLSTVEYSKEVVRRLCDAAFGKRWAGKEGGYIKENNEQLGQALFDLLGETSHFNQHRNNLARELGYDIDTRHFDNDNDFEDDDYENDDRF